MIRRDAETMTPMHAAGWLVVQMAWLLGSVTSYCPAQGWEVPRARDRNPDPAVFETVITVSEQELQLVGGKKTRMMTYNGSIPGPTIEAEIGTRLIVHVINLMSEPTLVHWHGVEVPAQMDGTPLSQAPIPKSGYHRYEFTLNNAATYWYHSHEKTNEQVERGLYGALIVRDPKHDAAVGVPRERERLIFLDDISLDKNNQLTPFSTDPRADFMPWKRAEDLVNSRVGNHLLINGRVVSGDKLPTFEVEDGVGYRLRFISVANGRVFRLGIPEGASRWYGIGSDQGLWNSAELIKPIGKVKNVLGHHDELISNPDPRVGTTFTPSDRLEVVVVPRGKVGEEVFLESHDMVKGKHIAYRDPKGELWFGHDHFDGAGKPMNLFRFKIVKGAGGSPTTWTPPKQLRWDPIQPLVADKNTRARPLPVFFGHGLPNRDTGSAMFFISVADPEGILKKVRARQMVVPADYDPQPFMKLRPEDGFHVRAGDTRVWEVINFTGTDHNFHTHGFRFQHLETEFIDLDEADNCRTEKPLRLAYEDTIRTPRRPGLTSGRSYTIVRLATRFDDAARPAALRRTHGELVAGGLAPSANMSGGWLVHCHFLEHTIQGMRSFITVTR
ncbi:MAG: multicopper oxidase family protein [Planctomycetota bacterium]|nr:multicopper oxidase family protein [Planctomycetota bacterium]